MFTTRKVGQMAAYLADRQGGRINILKLMKLLYLADRESFARHGVPISYDRFVSMDQGPVLSQTLDLINGTYPGEISADWDEWISDRENHMVVCNRRVDRQGLDQLSDADLAVLDTVWRQFGHMNQWELRDYTHQHLPEWDNPHGSSIPINERDILRAVGVDDSEIERLVEAVQTERELDRVFARL